MTIARIFIVIGFALGSARRRAAGVAACAVVALSACSNQPPQLLWQMEAHGASQRAMQAYLQGLDRVEAMEWERARAAITSTGRVSEWARLELLRCATRVASLVVEPCELNQPWSEGAALPEQAYARYLSAAPLGAGDRALLPSAQQSVSVAAAAVNAGAGASRPATDLASVLKAIDDPLARLVAAGVLLRQGKAGLGVAEAAIDAASAQGWRRPLLAWLEWGARQAQLAGDVEKATEWHQRAAVVTRGKSVSSP